MARYIIYGAGAIGGAMGASLFENGHEVVLIARGAHLEAIVKNGLQFDTPHGSTTQIIPAVDHPSKIEFREGDVVIIGVKSQDTIEVLHALAGAMPYETPVVCLQNGVENERAALRIFPNVYGAMIISPATHLSPGLVVGNSAAKLGIVEIGRYPGGQEPLAEEIAEVLNSCGWFAAASSAVQEWKYAKLIDNLSNATQVVLGLDARGGEIATRAKAEGTACLQAANISAISTEELSALRSAHMQPAAAGGRPRVGASTWQSLARGTGAVETDYLNGEIVLLGRFYGVPTPVNELLQRLANQIAREKNEPGSMTEEEFLAHLEG